MNLCLPFKYLSIPLFALAPSGYSQNGQVYETWVLATSYSRWKVVIMRNADDDTSDHPYKPCSGRWNWPLLPQCDNCHGEEENCQEEKSQVFCESLKLQSHHAHKVLCEYPLGQSCLQQGHFQRPCSETQGPTEGQDKFKERYNSNKNKRFFQKLWV